jgi:hypothetical protein
MARPHFCEKLHRRGSPWSKSHRARFAKLLLENKAKTKNHSVSALTFWRGTHKRIKTIKVYKHKHHYYNKLVYTLQYQLTLCCYGRWLLNTLQYQLTLCCYGQWLFDTLQYQLTLCCYCRWLLHLLLLCRLLRFQLIILLLLDPLNYHFILPRADFISELRRRDTLSPLHPELDLLYLS